MHEQQGSSPIYLHELQQVTPDQLQAHIADNAAMYPPALDAHMENNGIAVDRSQQTEEWHPLHELPPAHHQRHVDLGRQVDPNIAERPPSEQDRLGEVMELGETATNPVGQEQYVRHTLHKQEVSDTNGRQRTIYTIAGREVLFRNALELPIIEDRPYCIPKGFGQELTPTLGLFDADAAHADSYHAEVSPHTNSEALVITTNRPEALLSTAALLDPDHAAEMTQRAAAIASGTYDEKSTELLDALAACTFLREDGQLGTAYEGDAEFRQNPSIDIDGYALVLAALTGDESAVKLVNERVTLLKRVETLAQVSHLAVLDEIQKSWLAERAQPPESLTAAEVALVHSTGYPVERDHAGNVVLYPAASKRQDKFPRSTIHFVPNAQVTDHYAGTWGDSNRLIVANLEGMIERNGNPVCMNDVDTFYSTSPGEHITLPGATVIEPGAEDQAELFVRNGDTLYYKQLDTEMYSVDDVRQLQLTGIPFGIELKDGKATSSLVRELALRQVLAEKGVQPSMMGHAGAHYSDNQVFQEAYHNLAYELHVSTTSLHAYTQEQRLEDLGNSPANPDIENALLPGAYEFRIPRDALRQVIASGVLPTMHYQPKAEQNSYHIMDFGF